MNTDCADSLFIKKKKEEENSSLKYEDLQKICPQYDITRHISKLNSFRGF